MKNLIVLYSTSAFGRQLVKEFCAKNSLKPVLWVGAHPNRQKETEADFPGVPFIFQTDSNSYIQTTDVGRCEVTDSEMELAQNIKTDCFSIMERFRTEIGFDNYFDREAHYYQVFYNLLRVVKEAKPDVLYSAEIPHSLGSFIIFSICKHLGVKTIIRNWVPYYGRVTFTKDFEIKLPEQCADKFADYDFEKDNPGKQWVDTLSKEYDLAKPSYMKRAFDNYGGIRRKLKRFKVYNAHLKQRRYYDSLAKKVVCKNHKGKYVYFALHFQPEMSTSPTGGDFANQIYTLLLLSQVLPSDYKIFVKEHPAQFRVFRRNNLYYRSKFFYDRLSQMPKVTMVDRETNSFDLIDNSFCTATITGTIALESVARGKNSIVMSLSNKFVDIDGIFHAQKMSEIEQAFQKIKDGYIPNKESVIAQLNKIYKHSVYGFPGTDEKIEFLEENLDLLNKFYNA